MRFFDLVTFVTTTSIVLSTSVSSQLTGAKHCKTNRVGLSFDDGATIFTKQTIDQLVNAGQHATFCINVNNYVCNYDQQYIDLWRYAVSKKMTICSHTAGHPHLTQLSDDKVRFEIQAVNDYLNKTVGVVPRYFRFPYGESDSRVEDIVRKEFGMKVLAWSLDTEDSLGASVDQQVASISNLNSQSNDIIIMHDTHKETVEQTLPRVLQYFAQNNIKSSGAAKCLGHQHYRDAYSYYQPHNNPRQPDWNCNNIPIGNY